MILTSAQRNAIRSDADDRFYADDMVIGSERVDIATVRALMRIGLCVVESGATSAELRDLIEFLDPQANETDERSIQMMHALAAELEKTR